MNFLQDLNRKLTPLAQEETNILLELKRKESEEQGRLFENKLNMWVVQSDWELYNFLWLYKTTKRCKH